MLALCSEAANNLPAKPPVHAARAGKLRPTVICCEVADENQYNKLLGVLSDIRKVNKGIKNKVKKKKMKLLQYT